MHDLAESDSGALPSPPPPARDLATVQAALTGNNVARQRVVDLLADLPAMIRIKNARLGGRLQDNELDDVVQNVLLSLWRKLAGYDGRVPLLHWAYGFGVVEIRRTLERRGRRREREMPHEAATETAPDSLHDPERLGRLLAELDPAEQAVIRLKHFDGLTFDEIAQRLSLLANTAKTRYYRGLERLRQRLRPGHHEET